MKGACSMRYLIAMDGGGTKNHTVLFQEDGHVLYQSKVPGANPLDIGEAPARSRLTAVLTDVVSHSPEPPESVFCAAAGTPYYENFLGTDIAQRLGCRHFYIGTDAYSMISSGLYHGEDGCCLIVGTGCGVWVRRRDKGCFFPIGGWGYIIDTLGSGFSLGREVVRAVCLADDGRAPQTALRGLLCALTGKPPRQSLPWLYNGGRAHFASLAHLAFEGAAMGDAVSCAIVENGADRLAELVRTADQYVDGPYPVVMGGGIVTAYPHYAEMIRARCPARAQLTLAAAPPVFGAAVEAMRQCGLEVTEGFRSTFLTALKAQYA